MSVAFTSTFTGWLTIIQIRPANILLSELQVPVLVDFGFAEKYELEDETAFRSNLTYGTPEVSLFLLLLYMH